MTAQEKRDYIRLVSEKSLTRMLPDVGAKRALGLIQNGNDAMISSIFELFFADCWRQDRAKAMRELEIKKFVYNSVRT